VRRPVTVGAMAMLFALGMMLAVFVAGSAAAKSPKTTTTTSTLPSYTGTTTSSPGDTFFVINGTVNAASDHEIVGSSAFPNFTTGAVDNYYSMARAHVDNSPFAEGTASPADTGPVGQTAAAGNFQQPQYADARWPGDTGKATYGTQGQPFATAEAGEYRATADASEATNGLSGPGLDGTKTLALPNGFDLKLRQALAGWKSKWLAPLGLKKPATPKRPAVTTPVGAVTVPKAPVTVPKATVAPPTATVTTPLGTVTTPTPNPISGATGPTPPVTAPSITLPSAGAEGAPRSLASRQVSQSTAAPTSTPADGESLLKSSTRANLVPEPDKPCKKTTTTTDTTTTTKTKTTKTDTTKAAPCKTYALVTSGESSLGRVSLGGGQIVIEGIHVTASISNDGTPSYTANVSIASATIGGVPVTIDQDGVHIAGQGGALPYQQAGDALNSALKQAGIQLFLVGPEVTTSSCGDQSGTGSSSGAGGGTTTTGSSDQSGATSSCDRSGSTGTCDQSGTDTGTGGAPVPGLPGATPATSTDQSGASTMPSSCDQTCDSGAGAGTGSGTTTTTTTATTTSRSVTTPSNTGTTSTTSTDQSGGSSTTSSCGGTGLPSTTGSCAQPGTATGTTTTTSDQASTTSTGSNGLFNLGGGSANAGEEIVTATGLHVVFTQPVNQSGVPAQYVEHILGEVYVDSLAVPASDSPGLDAFSFGSSSGSSSSLGSSSSFGSSSSCGGGGHAGGPASGGSASGVGGSSSGLSGASGSLASSGSTSQPTAGTTGSSLPAMFATALRKPLWLLLAYVLWQAIVIGTGASLANWRRGGAS
jgi:hypothetical protein